MSCNYADGLSEYEDKGICGLPEQFDSSEDVLTKVEILAKWIKESNHVVVHTGAGISTTAGVPDFRGPNGVWTLEGKGIKPHINISFDEANPTVTHMALVSLVHARYIHYVISQNVDGLHLRSGFPPDKLSELHGNMFLDKCNKCKRLFVLKEAEKTVGEKNTGKFCPLPKSNKKPCRGMLHDTILDWEAELPKRDLDMAEKNSKEADLSICLGTTLQIVPSGNLPLFAKENNGKLVICNLQPTKHDRHADLLIHDYIDNIMKLLCTMLCVEIPAYSTDRDPTKKVDNIPIEYSTLIHTKIEKPKKYVRKLKLKTEAKLPNELNKETVKEENDTYSKKFKCEDGTITEQNSICDKQIKSEDTITEQNNMCNEKLKSEGLQETEDNNSFFGECVT